MTKERKNIFEEEGVLQMEAKIFEEINGSTKVEDLKKICCDAEAVITKKNITIKEKARMITTVMFTMGKLHKSAVKYPECQKFISLLLRI